MKSASLLFVIGLSIALGSVLGIETANATLDGPPLRCFCEYPTPCDGKPLADCLACWQDFCGRGEGCEQNCAVFACTNPMC